MRHSGILLVPLVLAGCANEADRWSKPGASAATATTELDRCQREARDTSRRQDRINSDIMASRGNDWPRPAPRSIGKPDLPPWSRNQGDRALAACMAAKGYSPAK